MRKAIMIILCICIPIALVVASCNIYGSYQSNKLLEEYKQRALQESRTYIKENAYLLDIIRYGEYTKYDMQMVYQKGADNDLTTDEWAPYLNFEVDGEEHFIFLHSDELNKYLSLEEIDTIIYLTELNGNRNCSNIYSDGINHISTSIGVNGVIVNIFSEPLEPFEIIEHSYNEQVGDYYIQMVANPPRTMR